MRSYRSLLAWQKAQELAIACGRVVRSFPGAERNAVGSQLTRACISVPLNIAEGSARRGATEFRRYLDIARGSLHETQTALDLARGFGYLQEDEFKKLDDLASETGRILWGLLESISRRSRRRPLAT